jgi:hypothetical protein
MTVGIYLRLAALIALVAIIVTLLRVPPDSDIRSAADATRSSESIAPAANARPPPPPKPETEHPSSAGAAESRAATQAKMRVPAERQAASPDTSRELVNGAASAPSRPDGASAGTSDSAKPIPLFPQLQRFLESAQHPATQAALQRHRELQQEPENAWSEDMEARLRRFVSAQPEASRVDALIACRARQCLIQLSDLEQFPENATGYVPPTQAISLQILREPWIPLMLQHTDSTVLAIERRTYYFAFFERAP